MTSFSATMSMSGRSVRTMRDKIASGSDKEPVRHPAVSGMAPADRCVAATTRQLPCVVWMATTRWVAVWSTRGSRAA